MQQNLYNLHHTNNGTFVPNQIHHQTPQRQIIQLNLNTNNYNNSNHALFSQQQLFNQLHTINTQMKNVKWKIDNDLTPTLMQLNQQILSFQANPILLQLPQHQIQCYTIQQQQITISSQINQYQMTYQQLKANLKYVQELYNTNNTQLIKTNNNTTDIIDVVFSDGAWKTTINHNNMEIIDNFESNSSTTSEKRSLEHYNDDNSIHSILEMNENSWLFSLSVNDKLDIFEETEGYLYWYIGTIIQKKENYSKFTTLTIHYDGWPTKFNESIIISPLISQSKKLKKLHTFTPHHNYLYDESVIPCRNHGNRNWIECCVCQRRCCCVCFVDGDLCKECIGKMNYGPVFETLVVSTNSKHNVDMNIIYCIIEYMGIVVECARDKCSESRIFGSMVQLRDCSLSKYKCTINCIAPGTIKIYGEYRRVFCDGCTTRLKKCQFCDNQSFYANICFNHKHLSLPVNICRHNHDEATELLKCKCGEIYCKHCYSYKHKNHCVCICCNKCVSRWQAIYCFKGNHHVCTSCRPDNMYAGYCVYCIDAFDWTIFDEQYNDYTFNDYFINKYGYNQRLYKMERKLMGFEKTNNLKKYHKRKLMKKKKKYKRT